LIVLTSKGLKFKQYYTTGFCVWQAKKKKYHPYHYNMKQIGFSRFSAPKKTSFHGLFSFLGDRKNGFPRRVAFTKAPEGDGSLIQRTKVTGDQEFWVLMHI
jgi:hypothetical protein